MLQFEKQVPVTFCGKPVYLSKTDFKYLQQKRLKGIRELSENFQYSITMSELTLFFRAGHFTIDTPTPLMEGGELEPFELIPFEDTLFHIMSNLIGKNISSIEDILQHWTCSEGKNYRIYVD